MDNGHGCQTRNVRRPVSRSMAIRETPTQKVNRLYLALSTERGQKQRRPSFYPRVIYVWKAIFGRPVKYVITLKRKGLLPSRAAQHVLKSPDYSIFSFFLHVDSGHNEIRRDFLKRK